MANISDFLRNNMTESLKQKLKRLGFPEGEKSSQKDLYCVNINETFFFITLDNGIYEFSIDGQYEPDRWTEFLTKRLESDSDFLAVKQFLEFLKKE